MRTITLAGPGVALLLAVAVAASVQRGPAPVPAARMVALLPGEDLQASLDAARPGDTIHLRAGATYPGPFRLPRKEGDGWIVIRTDAADFPGPGTRVTPAVASLMPKLVSSTGPVVVAEAGAHHYRFIGIEVAPVPGTFLTNLVRLGHDETSIEALPHTLAFERCYFHGDPRLGARRGIALNSAETTVADSYFADFKEVGADSQAIAGWNGTGPFAIINNYLEAAGENVMFGGQDPSIPNLVPSDVEIRRNHFDKPLAWREGAPGFQGTSWTVKNLFELKNARRVVIDGNLFEHVWPAAQNGFAVLFTPKNQNGHAPWTVVEDVQFTNNIVRQAGGGINILGRDDHHPSGQARRIVIRNNLFLDISDRLFQLVHGADEVTIDHNTAVRTGTLVTGGDDVPHTGFAFTHNIAPHGSYGIKGSGVASGLASIQRYFPGAEIRGNVFVGGEPRDYPSANVFLRTEEEVGFIDPMKGNYRLSATSPYRAGNGQNIGVDMDVLEAASHVAMPPPPEDGEPARAPVVAAAATGPPAPRMAVQTRAAAVLFWAALFLVGYTYVGYGVLVLVMARLVPRPFRREPIRPSVSIIVIAHNEAARIRRKIENLLELDYPPDRVEIIVASDGSTDDTVAIATGYAPRVRTVAFGARRGKPAILNDVVPIAGGEIVVLADARQTFSRTAVASLVQAFADPSVGAVSGALVILREGQTEAAAEGAAMYWELEKVIRRSESSIDSTIGATGAIYAIRRELFEPLPNDTLLDDVLLPLRIIRRGFRIVFEPEARAYDHRATAREEFSRKVRTIGGNFQLFATERWTLNPFQNPVWLQTVSHKVLRLGLPLFYLVILLSNVALLGHWFYQLTMAGQVAAYGAGLLGFLLPAARAKARVLVVPYTVCFLSWATIVGGSRYVTGRLKVTWERSGLDRRGVPRPVERRRRSNVVP